MATNNQVPNRRRTDRTRKAALATAAGAIPLALSMVPSTLGGKPSAQFSHAPQAARMTINSSDLQFHPACKMPFASSPVPDIDGQCSIEGANGSSAAKIAESKTKNDFCVSMSNVTPIQYQTFSDLQDKTTFKSSADRSPLAKTTTLNGKSIGEGTYVEYEGFLLHAQYSNKNNGEAVNCNIPGEDTNDIHIQMVNDPADDDACDSVTAQMSPHFRPESWTPDKLTSLKAHKLRLSGPLFYDDSHAPCRNGKRPNPQRISVWEIHPIYAVDVCKQKFVDKNSTCQDWIPLDQWNGTEGDEEEPQ